MAHTDPLGRVRGGYPKKGLLGHRERTSRHGFDYFVVSTITCLSEDGFCTHILFFE